MLRLRPNEVVLDEIPSSPKKMLPGLTGPIRIKPGDEGRLVVVVPYDPEIRGASPYVAIKNEPAPKLIVDPPLPEGLAQGIFWAQYRTENVHIAPVFGEGALQVSPRVGHLHISVDDLPWLWADASDNNTVDIGGLPPGPHKVKIELVDANHNAFPGQSKTLTFTVPESASQSHGH